MRMSTKHSLKRALGTVTEYVETTKKSIAKLLNRSMYLIRCPILTLCSRIYKVGDSLSKDDVLNEVALV